MSLSLLALLVAHADAAIYVGNPNISVKVDRPAHDFVSGFADLHTIRVNYCGGGYSTYTIDDSFDPVDGWSSTISGGDICSIVLSWNDAIEIDGPSYIIEHSLSTTTFSVGASIPPVGLTPITTIQGSYSGNLPLMYISLN